MHSDMLLMLSVPEKLMLVFKLILLNLVEGIIWNILGKSSELGLVFF